MSASASPFPVIARAVPVPIIYGLVDPAEPARVRYVGFTRQFPEARLASHIGESPIVHRSSRKVQWITSLVAQGRRPLMVLLEQVADGDEVELREGAWFAVLRSRGEADLNRTVPKGGAVGGGR